MDGFFLTLCYLGRLPASTHEVSGLPKTRFSSTSPSLLRDGSLQGCSAEPQELLSHPPLNMQRTSLFPTNPHVFLVAPHSPSFHHHAWDSLISSASLARRSQKEKIEKRTLILLRALCSVYIYKIFF